jgi:hypothetical protein
LFTYNEKKYKIVLSAPRSWGVDRPANFSKINEITYWQI